MNKSTKIIISIIAIIAIVVTIVVIVNNRKKYKVEEYVKPVYNYFAMFSDDGKVGVIDKTGKLLMYLFQTLLKMFLFAMKIVKNLNF